MPAPTEPLPWEHFKRMPKRLKGGRHHGVHVSSDMELPNVYSGGARLLCCTCLGKVNNSVVPRSLNIRQRNNTDEGCERRF